MRIFKVLLLFVFVVFKSYPMLLRTAIYNSENRNYYNINLVRTYYCLDSINPYVQALKIKDLLAIDENFEKTMDTDVRNKWYCAYSNAIEYKKGDSILGLKLLQLSNPNNEFVNLLKIYLYLPKVSSFLFKIKDKGQIIKFIANKLNQVEGIQEDLLEAIHLNSGQQDLDFKILNLFDSINLLQAYLYLPKLSSSVSLIKNHTILLRNISIKIENNLKIKMKIIEAIKNNSACLIVDSIIVELLN